MLPSVDLDILHEMTGNDTELEQELFDEFLSSAQRCITTLSEQCTEGENETWRTAAHSFKGISYTLGANALGDLCKKAQEASAASAAGKQDMLNNIKQAYGEVEIFLLSKKQG